MDTQRNCLLSLQVVTLAGPKGMSTKAGGGRLQAPSHQKMSLV